MSLVIAEDIAIVRIRRGHFQRNHVEHRVVVGLGGFSA